MKGKANSVRQKFPRSSAQWLTKNSQTIHLTFEKDFFSKLNVLLPIVLLKIPHAVPLIQLIFFYWFSILFCELNV